MNFKIRVVENIGTSSKITFGSPGITLEVENGTLIDTEKYRWQEDFENIKEINEYFKCGIGLFETEFELVGDNP